MYGYFVLGRQAPPVIEREIDVTVLAPRFTAPALSLTFETNALLVKPFSFYQVYSGSIVEMSENEAS